MGVGRLVDSGDGTRTKLIERDAVQSSAIYLVCYPYALYFFQTVRTFRRKNHDNGDELWPLSVRDGKSVSDMEAPDWYRPITP